MPETLLLEGPLDVPALRRALDAIAARHEILRTRFVEEDGNAAQETGRPSPVPMDVFDLSGSTGPASEAKLAELLAEGSARAFDLSRDLMLRARLVRLAETRHVLLVVMHHIASDGWSWGVFFREFAALYDGFKSGREVTLPDLPIQFADFAAWQRTWMQGPVLERQLAYWKRKLAGAPVFLELPTDRPRPAVQTFRGDRELLKLSPELSRALKELSRSEGATLFMTLLAAFQVLLGRYTRRRDLLVGTPMAGRTREQTGELIGFFVNTLPMRADLSGNPTVRQFLQQVRETAIEAMSHQELPFERLVETLCPERSAAHSPLVQVMFVLQNLPAREILLPGLKVTRMESRTATAKFDLTLCIDESDDGLLAALEYNTDLFDQATAIRMLEQYRVLLEAMVSHPDREISKLSLLSASGRHRLLVEWNDTETDYPRDKTVHELFEEQVERNPGAVALEFQEWRLTYADLNRQANRLAHHLQSLGVGPDTPVALCLERSPEMIVALLGILKAGGAYVSLDPSHPRERLACMLADIRPRVVLTRASTGKILPAWDEVAAAAEVEGESTERWNPFVSLNLDPGWDTDLPGQPTNPRSGTGPEHLAYISYTSGSTGRPKGVCIPHRAVNRLLINTDYLRLGPSDVLAQMANCAFDASTFEIWGALLHGGRLVIIPQSLVFSPGGLAAEIKSRGVTAMFVTTALFNQLSREVPGIFSGVRHVLFGGERAHPGCVREVLKNGPPGRLLHVYGPTETTTFATWHEVREVPDGAATIPIGRPLANTRLYVLDDARQPVPVGVPGELYIGGDGLARGYHNRPDLTAEKFVPHPVEGEAGGRLYRSGDLVRYLPDGNLEFLGRTDSQIKIRGFRVEPDEICGALSRHENVRECVITLTHEESGDNRLAAYFIPRYAPAPTPADLRAFLLKSLPDYMVPPAIIELDTLPLNANGKVDRRALPLPESVCDGSRRQYQPPRDAVEARLAGIWESVLGVERIGVNDRFFELGGHSLLAVRLASKIEKAFGCKLPVSVIFQAPSVAGLKAFIEEGHKPSAGSSLVGIQPQGNQPPLFLVHGVGGGMFWGYANLSRHLGNDRPVYAFKARAVHDRHERETIEDMAARYVKELVGFYPGGPILLGGYCFGGNVAYEMARQLEAEGREVSFLALMNCTPPNSDYDRMRWKPRHVWRFLENLCYWGVHFLRWDPRIQRQFLRWKLRCWSRRWGRRWKRLWGRAGGTGDELTGNDLVDLSAVPEDQRPTWSAHVRALASHRSRPYGGRVTLFRTRGHPLFCSFDPAYGWRELARGGVIVRRVPGAHESILEEPHVRALAREMEAGLAQVQPNGTPQKPS